MMKKRKQRLAPLFLAGVLAVGSLLIGGSLEAKAAGADHLVSTADEGQYLAVSGGSTAEDTELITCLLYTSYRFRLLWNERSDYP